jgi:putative hydrolase of the HAD superfamily
MKKIFLFDADGVLVIPESYGANYAMKKAGLDPSVLVELFHGQFKECSAGKMDLKDILAPLLVKWGYPHTIEEFLNDWFTHEHVYHQALIEYIQTLREDGYLCYLATDQEKYRAQFMIHTMQICSYVDGAYFSHAVGATKSDVEFYNFIHRDLEARWGRVDLSDIFFIDDDEKNVQLARSCGIDAVLYENQTQTIEEIQKRI